MNPGEHELQYPWADDPAHGTWQTLRPGVHWVRMPLPFALDHINLWVLDDEIDGRSRIHADRLRHHQQRHEASVGAACSTAHLPASRCCASSARIFIPDHFGLAHWLTAGGDRQRWSGSVVDDCHRVCVRPLSVGAAAATTSAATWRRVTLRATGMSDARALQQVRERGSGLLPGLGSCGAHSFHRIHEGDEIAIGPAHAKAHLPHHHRLRPCAGTRVAVLRDDRLLVAGDMVLPRISTNVSVFDLEPEADPLPRYLRSLDRLLLLPADTLVLPSHGKPFHGLHQRIGQQHRHHADRLDEVLAACAAPQTAASIVPVLFKRAARRCIR